MRSVLKSSFKTLALARSATVFRRVPITAVCNAAHARCFSDLATVGTSLADVLPQEIAHETAENEIDQEYLDVKKTISKDFKVQDEAGKSRVVLTRQHNGETITVAFDVQNVAEDEQNPDFNEDEMDMDGDAPPPTFGINFEVDIKKADGSLLVVDAVAADMISIKNIQHVPAGGDRDDKDLYTGPRFEDLEQAVQDAFYDYLSERKVDDDLSFFVLSHSREKEQAEYVNWLHKVLDFATKK